MAEKNTVAMFVQDETGNRVQVGWASPKDSSGVRTFEYLSGYEESRPKNVSFEDDELSQQIAEEQAKAREADGSDAPEFEPIVDPADSENLEIVVEEPLPAEPITEAPDEELAADPIDEQPDPEQADDPTDAGADETVELDNGGQIVDVADEDEGDTEDEEAEFQRLLAEEEAANKEQPQTRRELRETEGDN